MYGLIGKLTATPGQRDALVSILLDGVSGMPGCLSYVVAHDPKDDTAIWITEVWDRQESHAAALTLPSVRDAIKKGTPTDRCLRRQRDYRTDRWTRPSQLVPGDTMSVFAT